MSCGVDEAGRGPVIGPMVVAGVCASRDALIRLGVKDSKKLSPKRREKLAKEIREVASQIVVLVVEPEEIDALRREMSLNEIEVELFARIISKMKDRVIYVDAADVDEERFAREIVARVEKDVEIISKHRADSLFPEVSAASIIAKVERDRRIEELKKEIGDFGSGYPADERTKEYLKEYFKKHGDLPPHVRRSWKSARRFLNKKGQSNLGDFS